MIILVFAHKPPPPHLMARALPIALLPQVMVMVVQATQPIWLLIPLHLITFFFAAMVCHGAIARDRPSSSHLTEFYLWLSVGGVLGGLFNAILAPLIFSSVVEYPAALVLLCLLLAWAAPQLTTATRRPWLDVALPLALGGIVVSLVLLVSNVVVIVLLARARAWFRGRSAVSAAPGQFSA